MSDRATKGGGVSTDLGFMARLMTAAKFVVTGATDAWFGPSQPIAPAAPVEVKGRAWDYPVASNINTQPRSSEGISFIQMRALADNYDLLRIIIETVKDEIVTQEWVIKPKDTTAKPDSRCDEVTAFFQFPDKEHDHGTWLRIVLEDMLVTDAPCLYPRMDKGGKNLYALEPVDGATIKRLINADGRTPIAPDPAYQQILKGIPAVDYTRDELIYFPRNLRSNRIYGYSPVEQIIMTVNIALRRQINQLEFYTEGNIPDLLFGVPSTWQPDQIRQMQLWWDSLKDDPGFKRQAKFIPGDVKPYDTKEKALKDEYDEWLARIVCFAFTVAPTPFIKQMNRATAETSKEASKEDGKGPRMLWVKRLHDYIIMKYFGYMDLEFGWQDQTAVDPLIQAQIDKIYLQEYVIAPDEVRARIGLEGAAPEKPLPPALGQPVVEPGAEPPTGEVTPPAAPVEKVERVKKKPVVAPIDRNRAAITKARAKFTKALEALFETAADDIADQISAAIEQMNRTESDDVARILAELDMNGWTVLVEPAEKVLEAIYRDGAHVALAQIGVEEKDHLTDLLNERALQFAEERGAELVGMRNMGTKENPEWVENPEAKWAITDSTRGMLRADVTKAIEDGWSPGKVKSELKENYAFSSDRAETIARTEIAMADIAGNMDAYRTSGIVTGKEWIVGSEHDDDDECDENAAAGVIGLDEPFPNGDDAPVAHPNCLIEGTVIFAAGVAKHFKRWFEGEVVVLSVTGMDNLAITPNHPVLTNTGWVAAGLLKKGDNLFFCDNPRETTIFLSPDDNHMETCIEQVAGALLMSGGMPAGSMPTSSIDFHGDGVVDGKVNIIRAASLLTNNTEPFISKSIKDESLCVRHDSPSLFNTNSAVAEGSITLLDPTDSIVGSGCLCEPLRGSEFGSNEQLLLAQISNHKPHTMKPVPKCGTVAPDTLGNITRRLSSHIRLVQLDDVVRRKYLGHVYNLQTKDNFYIAHNLLVHNCVCDVLPVLLDTEE